MTDGQFEVQDEIQKNDIKRTYDDWFRTVEEGNVVLRRRMAATFIEIKEFKTLDREPEYTLRITFEPMFRRICASSPRHARTIATKAAIAAYKEQIATLETMYAR